MLHICCTHDIEAPPFSADDQSITSFGSWKRKALEAHPWGTPSRSTEQAHMSCIGPAPPIGGAETHTRPTCSEASSCRYLSMQARYMCKFYISPGISIHSFIHSARALRGVTMCNDCLIVPHSRTSILCMAVRTPDDPHVVWGTGTKTPRSCN